MSEINLSASQLNEAEPGKDTAPPSTKKRSANFPMRVKMLISMLFIALIPLGAFFYIDYLFLHSFVSNLQEGPLITAAGQTANNVDDFISDNREILEQASAWPELVGYLETRNISSPTIDEQNLAKQSLQRLQRQSEGSISFALLAGYGENVLDTDENAIGNSELDNAYFSEPIQSGQAYISPVIFESSGKAYLYVSVPVYNEGRVNVGVLRARYNANVLQALMAQQADLVGPSSAPMLIDENDVILANAANPDEKFKLLVRLDDAEIQALQAAGRLPKGPLMESYANFVDLKENLDEERSRAFTFFADIAGDDDWQAAYKVTETQPWRVVFLQPESTFSVLIRGHVFTLAVILAGLSLVIFLTALNVSRFLTKPLLRLADVAQQIAGGAFGLHVPVESRDEVGLVAYAFNQVTGQMRDLTGSIDQIISERTQALGSIVRSLETSTKIGRQITTILDHEELLRQVVNRIQIEFNFYYTHIYLVDEETGDLIMAQGSGEVGRRLKARGHRLAAGDGIVGTVAVSNEFFLSNNVSKVLNYVPNEELPDTRSELALPLRKGNRVLGVLDIQDTKVNRFTSAEVSLMQSIANQTAIAIDNARLLAEMQATLKEVERLNRRLTREGWDQFEEDIETPGYRFVRGTTMPLTPGADVWVPTMKRKLDPGQLVEQTNGGNGDKAEELAIPLILRGEIIGVLGVKRDEEGNWDDEEVAAVEAVANQVTLALENARLSKEQEKTISQLKEVDRLKDEFLTSMSHELRTPLNSIIGFADVILQGIDGEVNDLAMNDVRLIHNSGKHLLSLINDVLDLAKIEAGKMELVQEDMNIDIIVDDVLASTNALVMGKPVEIVKEIQDNLPDIYVDEIRFKQVLINLVSNASKFTDEGQVTLKVERYPENPDNFALISVIDTGIGIPNNMIKTVFDRFGQVASKKTSKVGGTGLGLPICKQLVEMHGGTIEATSEEGVGSNFHFTVPFAGADLGEENTAAAIEKLLDAVKRL
jgi:signal transduction histidine kinase/HAMP domain-containing protein